MTHLNQIEFHAHRTSCLAGGEFPCREALPPEPEDPIWDEMYEPSLVFVINRRKSLRRQ